MSTTARDADHDRKVQVEQRRAKDRIIELLADAEHLLEVTTVQVLMASRPQHYAEALADLVTLIGTCHGLRIEMTPLASTKEQLDA